VAGKNRAFCQFTKWTDVFQVVAPSLQRVVVQRLADLPAASRQHGALGRMKLQAPVIPGEPEEVQYLEIHCSCFETSSS
jgi:hypothetical protein